MNRRKFVKDIGIGSLFMGMGLPQLIGQERARDMVKLTILHTNDFHSRIDPFEDGKYKGKGGVAARASLINKVRQAEEYVLLLDAGDIFQGTPYFNFFGGELEFKAMSAMQYDAATIGNHDFDAGIEGLDKQLPHANFPFLIANYDFSDTIMNGKTHLYKVFRKGPLKIGVSGVGIELDGLVPKDLYKATRYMDPIEKVNEVALQLKEEEGCDLVIILSHLGYKYKGDLVSDHVLAKNTSNVDIIIGGHTHTFLDRPEVLKNKKGEAVLINQVGWAGIMLGKLEVYFQRGSANKCYACQPMLIE